MRGIRLVLVAALALALSALARPATAAAGGTITGHVYDSDGRPLAGVNLMFGMAGPTTAADGSYSITVPSGPYGVILMVPNMADGPYTYEEWANWDVTVTGNMVEDFTLPARVPLNLTVRTAQGQALANTSMSSVVSRESRTLADGSVLQWNGVPHIGSTDPKIGTDWSGQTSFSALLGSSTIVSAVSSPGTMATSGSVSVPTNPTTATATLAPLRTLTGTLENADGTGIPNASMSFTSSNDNDGASGTVTTGSAGAYSIQGPDDPYTISTSFSGAPLPGFSGGSDMYFLTVTGNTTFNPTIPAAVPIRVHLQHYDGTPATEASVTGTDSLTQWARDHYGTAVPADNNGNATTEALSGASVTIVVADPGQSNVSQTITAPTVATDPNGPADVTILVGPRPAATDVVSGHVFDPTGAPMSGVTVQVTSLASATPTSVTTAADGSWTANVAPGSVTIKAGTQTAIPTNASASAVPGTAFVAAQGSVTAPTSVAQDITLPAMQQFTARVADASGDAVAGVHFLTGPWSSYHQTMGGVDYTISGSTNVGAAASDASGNITFWALDNSTNTGSTQQADGFVAPMQFSLTTPASPNEITMGWFGTVQSQGIDAGPVTISAPPGVTLSQLQAAPATSTPDGQTALIGNVSYEVSGIPVGSTQDITITLPPGSNPTNVFKVDSVGATTDASSYSTISGNTIVMHLTDGGPGDADGKANGVIVDPVLATRVATVATAVAATPTPSLASPITVNAGSPYTFTGAIRAGGQPAHGAVVCVLIRKLGTANWSVLGSTRSDAYGNLSFAFTPARNSQLMWAFYGAPGFAASTSAAGLREVDVRPRMSLYVTHPNMRLGSTTTFWGVMNPGLAGERVSLRRVINGVASNTGVTATIKLQRLPNGSVGYGFMMPFRPSSRGILSYVVLTAKDDNFAAASSNGIRLDVY